MPVLKRVGHKGAHSIVPGNTLASFDAALAAGVDMIEFDVLPEDWRTPATTRLLLAHDYVGELSRAPTLDEGLAHLSCAPFAGVELDVDLKAAGYESRVVDALREHDLVDRTLISSHYKESLAAIRSNEPRLRLGWSVPRVRRDYTKSPIWILPALGAITVAKRALPRRAAAELEAGRCDALMVHFRLVTPQLVDAVRSARGELYVWTVDDAAAIRALEALGVTGVISNDPRLFGALAT